MAKVTKIAASEPRPYMVFSTVGYVDGFTSESAAETFARAASKSGALRYRVIRLMGPTGMPRTLSEFANGRRV